jgi:hypothetical protein
MILVSERQTNIANHQYSIKEDTTIRWCIIIIIWIKKEKYITFKKYHLFYNQENVWEFLLHKYFSIQAK